MRRNLILAAQLAWPFVAGFGQTPAICLQDRVRLDSETAAAMQREFEVLVPSQSLGNCQDQALIVVVAFDAPARYANALGLTYRSSERILPRIELFLNPVLRALGGSRAPEVVGRALARIAAHEVAHYILQQQGHDANGLLRESFPAWQLGAESPVPFLLAKK